MHQIVEELVAVTLHSTPHIFTDTALVKSPSSTDEAWTGYTPLRLMAVPPAVLPLAGRLLETIGVRALE